LEVLLGGKCLCLEAGHLTGGSCRVVLGAAADHGPQGGIEAEAFSIVDVFVASQATVDGLAEESQQAVLGVQSGAGGVRAAGRGAEQDQSVVEFPVGEQSGVTGDGRAVELQLDVTVEVNAQGVMVAVTHWVPRSFRQEVVGNAGLPGKRRKRHAETTESSGKCGLRSVRGGASVRGTGHAEDQGAGLLVQQAPARRFLPGGEFLALEPLLEAGEGCPGLLPLAESLLGQRQEQPAIDVAALAVSLDRLLQ